MADSTPLSRHKTTQQDSKHHEKKQRPFRSSLKHYWFEISVTAMLATGIFLLVERMQIKGFVYRLLMSLLTSVADGASWLWGKTLNVLSGVEKSDVVGILLVLAAFVMIAHRGRLRAIKRHADLDQSEGCPECDGPLDRVRRTSGDRITEWALWIKIKRYACTKCSFRRSSWQSRF